MKKYKTEHYETLKRDLFPRMIPHPIFSGETNREIRAVGNSEPQLGYNPEPLLEPAPEPISRYSKRYGNGLGILTNIECLRCPIIIKN